ncbi:MAG: pantothenate kinase [Pseudomonas sp.]
MILELDCGNSLIKWRVIKGVEAPVIAAGVADCEEQLLCSLEQVPGLALRYCRLASVRGDAETAHLVGGLTRRYAVTVSCAEPVRLMAGVSNGYKDYQCLGLDRWLAVLGAYHLAGGACLVLDLGTAVTSDLVTGDGEHMGGYICPGVPLMRDQLRTHTGRIRYDELAAERALDSLAPGRCTTEAVERGCVLMLRGFVLAQLELARECLGQDFQVFLTGGDAALVREVLPEAQLRPDLVFIGLAIACPLP